MTQSITEKDQPIVATAGRYYRNTRYLISFVILIGMGLWFGYDGWKKWPAQQQQAKDLQVAIEKEKNPEKKADLTAALGALPKRTDTDIRLQRRLGFVLPIAGIALLIWTLYNSRGAYRFTGDTLEAPGHPPVKLSEMKSLDRDLWDRKGIAYIDYETTAGQKGQIRLDDFVYERPPTDEIYERVRFHFYGEEKDEDDEADEPPATDA